MKNRIFGIIKKLTNTVLCIQNEESQPITRTEQHKYTMVTKTLGTTSARLLTTLGEENQHVFSIADAREILGSSYNTTLQTLRRLTSADWVVRLTAGRYAIVSLSSGNTGIIKKWREKQL